MTERGELGLTATTDRGRRPPSAAAEIFISYRRQEANYLAGWLHDRLADHFGNSRVFLDIDWIKPGARFMEAIIEAIAHASAVIVIIGPKWLDADREGCRRLETPGDPVRVEIETAFRVRRRGRSAASRWSRDAVAR